MKKKKKKKKNNWKTVEQKLVKTKMSSPCWNKEPMKNKKIHFFKKENLLKNRKLLRKTDEIPLLFITLNEIHDADGTFFVTFFGLLQCTMDYTDHVLHAHTDSDTVTDSDLAPTPSSNERIV